MEQAMQNGELPSPVVGGNLGKAIDGNVDHAETHPAKMSCDTEATEGELDAAGMDHDMTKPAVPDVSWDQDAVTKEKNGVHAMVNEQEEKKAQHKEFLSKLGRRWFTVEPVVIIYAAMFSCIGPAIQQYIHQRLATKYNITGAGYDNITDKEACILRGENERNGTGDDNEANFQEELSQWNNGLIVANMLPVVFVLFIIGTVSDHRGRRLGFVPQLLVQVIASVVTTIVVAFDLPLGILVLTALLQGLTGSVTVVFMACYAYIADINPPEKRLLRIVLIEVGMGLGALVGGLLIGWMIEELEDFVIPNILITIMMGILALYTTFFIPETILKDPDAPAFKCSYLSSLPKLWFHGGQVAGVLPVIWLCFGVMLLNYMLGESAMMITTLYLLDPPLCWGATLIGLYNGVSFMVKALGCMILMKALHGRIRPPYMVMLGVVSCALGYVCLGLATNDVLPFIGILVGCATMLVSPVCRSIGSMKVPDHEQGTLFSGLGFAQTLAFLVGSPVVNSIFGQTPVYDHRYIFLGSAAASVITIGLAVCLLFVERKYSKVDEINIDGKIVTDTEELVINS